jgi:hypothetical protein
MIVRTTELQLGVRSRNDNPTTEDTEDSRTAPVAFQD